MVAKQPAFPCEIYHKPDGTIDGVQTGSHQGIAIGLTKREYFAAMAMQGMLSPGWSPLSTPGGQEHAEQCIARRCVVMADLVMKELEARGSDASN